MLAKKTMTILETIRFKDNETEFSRSEDNLFIGNLFGLKCNIPGCCESQ